MPNSNSLPFSRDRVTIDASSRDGSLLIAFVGMVDQDQPGDYLDPLFEALHERAVSEGAREVVADFTKLTFLNSSGLRSVAKWLMRHTQLDPASRYKVRVLYSESMSWQRANIKVLASMVRGSFEAEVVR